MPNLDRNRDIVDATSFVIATPSGHREQRRGSGTWATIRYTRTTAHSLRIVYPDGTLAEEETPIPATE